MILYQLKIPWSERVRNKEVLTKIATERTLMLKIGKKQLKFLRHEGGLEKLNIHRT